MRDHICPMKIKVSGIPTHMQAVEPVEEIVIKNRTQIAPKVIAYLETHDYRKPLLLALPVGSGKTYTTIHHVVPWAVERKLQVLFISSRSAINLQVKEELLNVVGLTNLRRQLTDEGLSKQEEFGPVTVMTYHKLGILLQREPDTLKKYGVVVFDEVHCSRDGNIAEIYRPVHIQNHAAFFRYLHGCSSFEKIDARNTIYFFQSRPQAKRTPGKGFSTSCSH